MALKSKISSTSLFDLPSEILENIIDYAKTSNSDLDNRLSKVCRQFKDSCHSLSIRIFITLERDITTRLDIVKAKINSGLVTERLLTLIYVLEAMHLMHRLIRAVTWRHTYRKEDPQYIFCGELLDLFKSILHNAKEHWQNPSDYILEDMLTMCFEPFEEVCGKYEHDFEKTVNKNYIECGAKIIDILDCIGNENKTVLKDETDCSSNRIRFTAEYRFPLAWWYSRSSTPNDYCGFSWATQQFTIYQEIRRLVFENTIQILKDRFQASLIRNGYHLSSSTNLTSFSRLGFVGKRKIDYGCMSQDYYLNNKMPCQEDLDKGKTAPEYLVTVKANLYSPLVLGPYQVQNRFSGTVVPDREAPINGIFSQQITFHCAYARDNSSFPSTLELLVRSPSSTAKQNEIGRKRLNSKNIID